MKNLYRGKRVDNDEWVYGAYFCDGVRHYIITEIVDKYHAFSGFYSNNVELFVVIPETVGQHTGVRDKNGKRIFDGDIIRFRSCWISYTYRIISYDNFGFMIHDKNNEIKQRLNDYICGISEVIGNVHDNPELMNY